MIQFQHVEYLWLLLLVPLLIATYIYFLNWRKAKLNRLAEAPFIPQLIKGKISGRTTTKLSLTCLALICGILGLANLQAGGHTEKTQRNGLDVIFALDVSKSMLAKDISPDRLSRAKELVYRMVDKMKNDRTGLVIFAGNAYLQVPLTIDYGAMKMLLQSVSPDMVPSQGTVLSDAIQLAQKSFSTTEKKHKVIILISDGEDHDEQALKTAKEAAGNGIIIYTVGVGSAHGSTIFDPTTGENKVDENGQPVITRLNEQELQALASATGGSYQLLNNANKTAASLVSNIDQMETKNLGSVVYTDYESYFPYFLTAALFCLVVCWLLPDARRLRSSGPAREKNKTTKTMVMLLALTVCSVLFSFRSFAQEQSLPEPRKELKAGNKSYQQKDYNAASKAYLQAVKKNPKSFSGNYNLGDALYQANQNEAARQAFQRSLPAAGNKLQQAEAFHNIGNTYLKEKKWDEAASAFKQALKLNSKDMDTKYNLAYAQAMIKKDQQNNKDNKKNKNNQDKQDQQNKDQQKQNKKEQEDKNKKDRPDKGQQNKDQQDNKQETAHPRPQASKLTKQQADNILNALSQEEKKLHEEKEKGKAVPMQQDKDW